MEKKYFNYLVGFIWVVALVLNFYALFSASRGWPIFVWNAAKIVACVFAVFYLVDGAKKESSRYFKYFAIAFTVQCAIRAVVVILETPNAMYIAGAVLAFVAAVILTFVKDLGKTNSFALIGFVTLVDILYTVMLVVTKGVWIGIGDGALLVMLSLIFLFIIAEKYKDKAERYAKTNA